MASTPQKRTAARATAPMIRVFILAHWCRGSINVALSAIYLIVIPIAPVAPVIIPPD
jgi:hypothetical protein